MGLSALERGLHRAKADEVKEGARILETVLEEGLVSLKWEPLVTLLAGLGYDSIGENNRARRLYMRLQRVSLPLPISDILYDSPQVAKLFTESISNFGLRRMHELGSSIDIVTDFCQRQLKDQKSTDFADDRLILLSFISLLNDYRILHTSEATDIKPLSLRAQTLEDSATELDISDWLLPLILLFARSVGSSLGRSILSLPVPSYLKKRLVGQTKVELWPPQFEAVRNGLFRGQNIVYATPPGSGKTLLTLLLAGNSSPTQKTIYVVPTRTLAEEAYGQLRETVQSDTTQVAISTRDRTAFDDALNQFSVLVTTYEKLSPLLKKGKFEASNISRLLVDEAQKMSDEDRGIMLEFLLTKYKSLSGREDPQIVAISGIIRNNDAERLSDWLGSTLVTSSWRPVDLDETIFCDGKLYHKDGTIEKVNVGSGKLSGSIAQRIQIASLLTRLAVVKGGQCLIAIESRRRVEEVAQLLKNFFSSAQFDPDLQTAIREARLVTDKLHEEIVSLEPELSAGYTRLAELLKWGVAYHHGGMPSVLREIVERGVREKGVRALVTTTTFEAGVNLPVSDILFPFASGGGAPMKVATYRNLAARAGRPGFDIKGRSVIITLTEQELIKARGRFFEGEPEALDSAIQYFLRNRPPARYSIQGQILGLSTPDDTIETKDISYLMTNTWFWTNASGEARQKFLAGVDVESNKLCKYGFLETISRGRYRVTPSGRAASRSTLSPFSTKLLLDNLGRITRSGQENDKFDHLILALVGLPFELEEYDEYLRNISIPQDLDYLSKVITADPGLRELYQRVEKCPRYAALLRQWIDGTPVDEILRICGLDASIDASLLEGTLPNDANWVLNSLLEMPGAVLKTSAVQRTRIEQVAAYCKYGTRDPIAISLLSLGFKHLGRGTAMKLASYFRTTNKSIVDLTLNELNSVFPGRNLACTRLSEEIAEKFQKVNN